MKAKAIAARFKRTLVGAFASAQNEAPVSVSVAEAPGRRSDSGFRQKAVVPAAALEESHSAYAAPVRTSPSDAWQIMKEHRAHLTAAIAAGLFATRIR